jgi:hypothetical protein
MMSATTSNQIRPIDRQTLRIYLARASSLRLIGIVGLGAVLAVTVTQLMASPQWVRPVVAATVAALFTPILLALVRRFVSPRAHEGALVLIWYERRFNTPSDRRLERGDLSRDDLDPAATGHAEFESMRAAAERAILTNGNVGPLEELRALAIESNVTAEIEWTVAALEALTLASKGGAWLEVLAKPARGASIQSVPPPGISISWQEKLIPLIVYSLSAGVLALALATWFSSSA